MLGMRMGLGLSSGTRSASGPPVAPVLSEATDVLDTSFTANWGAVAGADSYRLDVSTDIGFSSFVTGYEDKTVSGTSQSITGLSRETTYYYRVRAAAGARVSDDSNTITQLTTYTVEVWNYGTGAAEQTIMLGNSVEMIIVTTGFTIKSYTPAGGSETSVEANTLTLPAVAEGANPNYHIIKFNAMGGGSLGGTKGTLQMSKTTTMHYFYWNLITGGATTYNWNFAPPTGLTFLYLNGCHYNYDGAMHEGIKSLTLSGALNVWKSTAALPASLSYITLIGNNIEFVNSASLPDNITYTNLNGSKINWTGLSVGNGSNIRTLTLTKYRTTKMSSADMIILLTQIADRTGNVPNVIAINDYADYASPPPGVTATIAYLKSKKPNVTTVNLGA